MSGFSVTVHGKDLNENMTNIFKAVGVLVGDNNLYCVTPTMDGRDKAISALVANGFEVISSYREGRGWKVSTVGVVNDV